MVDIALPGWRWEVKLIVDGTLEFKRYQSVAGVETHALITAPRGAETEQPWQDAGTCGSASSIAFARCRALRL